MEDQGDRLPPTGAPVVGSCLDLTVAHKEIWIGQRKNTELLNFLPSTS
jgi:hypothetical protein